MDLLLTHGYFLAEDAKELQIMRPYAPLGILYLCSHLRAKGFRAEVFDSTFRSRGELTALLHSTKPSWFGIYANFMTRANAVKLLKEAKQAGWKTIVGGSDPAEYVQEYLQHGADVVALGEGEHTLEEMLSAPDRQAWAAVDGIAYLEPDGSVHRTAARRQIANVDAQPWPARDAIDLQAYMARWREFHGKASLAMMTARGCPYRCNWCSRNVFGNTHRRRTPALVADELQFLLARYSPDMIWYADDVFTMSRSWILQYAAELRRRRIHIPFETISRADRMDREVVDALAQMGCFRLWVGCESGSQRVLDGMERGVTTGQVEASISMCRERGIATGMFLMWGYEGEELEDIQATIDHVKRSKPDVFFTTVAYPVKGTKFYDMVNDRVVNDSAWELTSDRDNRIRGRHSRRFYRFADQALRAEVELHNAKTTPEQAESLKRTVFESKRAMVESFAEAEA